MQNDINYSNANDVKILQCARFYSVQDYVTSNSDGKIRRTGLLIFSCLGLICKCLIVSWPVNTKTPFLYLHIPIVVGASPVLP